MNAKDRYEQNNGKLVLGVLFIALFIFSLI